MATSRLRLLSRLISVGLPLVVAAGVLPVLPSLAPLALADPPSAPLPPEPVPLPEDPIEPGPAAVGTLPGSGGVSPGGEYGYSVPLVVPDGRLGMQPHLSLEYSSSGGNGPMGVGWSVSGFSGIVRCSKTWAQDGVSSGVKFDRGIDRFCLDGQRLMLVGSIAGAPVEYGGNDTVYRTETESFAHIVAKASPATVEQGPDQFEVRTKAGRILQYEAFTANQESSLVSVSGANAGSQATVSRRVAWLLTRERDRSGNEIRYEYLQPVAGQGIFLPWKVRYTFDSGANPQAYRTVEFVYADRPAEDRPVVFQAGVRSTLTKRLDMIKMFAPNPVEAQLVWSYQFGFHVSTQTSRLMLDWVRRCGYLNTCTQKKTFSYSDPVAPTFVKRTVAASGEGLYSQSDDLPQAQLLDLNGDGATDILYSRGLQPNQPPGSVAPHHIRLGARVETAAVPLAVRYTDEGVMTASRPVWTMRGTDIDSDGTTDIGIPVTEGLPPQRVIKFYQWDDTQHVLEPKNMVAPGGHYTELADLNGDGHVDVMPVTEITEGLETRFTITAALNTGSGFTAASQSQYFDYGCPTRLADLDGDGHMELVGNPRMPLEDLPIEIDEEEGVESWPGKSRGAPRPTHPTLDLRCRNGSETYQVRLDGTGQLAVAAGFTTFNGARAYRVPPLDMDNQVTVMGDFNGDGLSDVLLAPRAGGWSKAVFNTGNGLVQVGPETWLANGGTGAAGSIYPPDVRVGDLTGDGRDDLLVLTDSGITLKVSRGDGTFADRTLMDQSGVPFHAGIKATDMGRTMTQLGDFNADGRLDLVQWGVLGEIDILEQDTNWSADLGYASTDRMVEVGDEDAPLPLVSVEYSMSWTEHPEWYTNYICSYPLVCLRSGMPVVRRTKSYAHLDTAASAPGAYLLNYTYEDPVVNVRGRGGLGFGTFRVWDPQRPSETVTTYQNRAHTGDYYSGAGRPKIVQTVTPILTQDQVGQQVGTAQARVVRTVNTFETRQLNNDTTYAILGPDSLVREWEEPVSIQWASVIGTAHTEHIFDVETSPSNILRTTNVDVTFNDDYGNLTSKVVSIDGGVTESETTTFDNRLTSPTDPALWLIGLPTRTAVTSTAVGGAAVTRTADRNFDALGRLDTVWVEKDHADARLRNTTSYELAADGVLLSTTVTSPPLTTGQQMPHRQVHYEYGRPFGVSQPDERIHTSQVWSSHVPEQYRPSAWTTTHPAYGIPLLTMDINGVVSSSRYDDLGRLRRTDADGAGTTTLTYQQRLVEGKVCGVAVTATGPTATTRTTADRAGRAVEEAVKAFDGTFAATVTGYDKFGRAVTATPPAPEGSTTSVYDSLDRVVKVTGPDGKFSTADHTFLTRLTTDPQGFQKRATRDVSGRTVAATDFLVRPGLPTLEITTGYQYAPFGQLSVVTDPAGHTTTMSYDLRGRRTQLVSPDRGRIDTTYFGTGEPLNETHYDTRNFTTFGYDDLGRVTSSTTEDGLSTFAWDTASHGIGQRAYAVSPDNIRTNFRYDDFGRSAGVDYIDTVPNATYSVDNHYDSAGRLLSQELPGPAGVSRFTLQYDYNGAGHLAAMRYAKPGSSTLLPMWDVLTRKPNGALDTATLGAGAGLLTLSHTYQPATALLSSQLVNKGSTTVHHRSYGYYDNGLVQTREDTVTTPSPRVEQFGYDSLSRLTGWDIVLPPPNSNQEDRVIETDYGYDSIGNMTSVSRTDYGSTTTENRTHGKVDGSQPHTLTGVTGPDAQTLVYDSEGRQTTGSGRGVTYTSFDLPKTVTKGGQTTTYYYDAFGQRIKEVGPTETTVYVPGFYEKRTSGSATKHIYHVPGVEGASAQAIYDGTDTTVTYQLTDALGSISTATDANGDVSGRFYFDPFGLRINVDGTPFTGSTGDIHHGFTGHEHDGDLNLINMNGRVEDPGVRNFLTPDPLNTAGANPYSYVSNSPLNFTDPSGYRACADGMLKGKHQYTGEECSNLSGKGININPAVTNFTVLGPSPDNRGSYQSYWNQANAAEKRSSDAARPAATRAEVEAYVKEAWGWLEETKGDNPWAAELDNANCLETCSSSAGAVNLLAHPDGNPNDRRNARKGYEEQYDRVEITTLVVGLALYGAGLAGGAAYKAFLFWCAAHAAACAFLPFLLSAVGPPGSPGPSGAVNVFANNQRTILSRFGQLARGESVGMNAGKLSAAVNGIVDLATGEIIALGNVSSNLPQRARDMLANGSAAQFTITETMNLTRGGIPQHLSSAFSWSQKVVTPLTQTVRGQLDALVTWMQQTQPTLPKP